MNNWQSKKEKDAAGKWSGTCMICCRSGCCLWTPRMEWNLWNRPLFLCGCCIISSCSSWWTAPLADTKIFWWFVLWGSHLYLWCCAIFLLTGWLTPPLLERDTRTNYLINRIFRIFPTLIISTIVLFFIQKYLHASALITVKNVFGTATTSYREKGGDLLNGGVWALAIEFNFICYVSSVGRGRAKA